jgi:hypothetical protein
MGAAQQRPQEAAMKLLLTSAGIKNPSIESALVEFLGKPISEAGALCIPTAMYGHPWVGPGVKAWEFISGREPQCPMCELGWKSLGVLELTALPSIDEERWVPLVQETDVLLASGGLPENTMANAEKWAAGLSGPAYAIDDETAIKVTHGTVEVVSEGHWELLTPSPFASESG